jgi:hypothetical protein
LPQPLGPTSAAALDRDIDVAQHFEAAEAF